MRLTRKLAVLVAAVAVIAAACSSGGGASAALTKVRLQLQWFPQAQFAGYFAALDQGYYKDGGARRVDPARWRRHRPGDRRRRRQRRVRDHAGCPKMLASRESGADVQVIGQVFQRSGTLQVAFKDKNITKPDDWKGKKVGTWGFGNEAELYAAMRKVGIDPEKPTDVTIVPQQFDMVAFAAAARSTPPRR